MFHIVRVHCILTVNENIKSVVYQNNWLIQVRRFHWRGGLLCLFVSHLLAVCRYRLAPENKFPAAFDDCETATRYLLRNAKDFGVDPSRVALAGRMTTQWTESS